MASDRPVAIVGIGASAGGVEALERLLRPMPSDTGLAFVVVTHMARGRESVLPEILGRFTAMPVVEAADDMLLLPNRVHIAPPDHMLMARGGGLRLEPRNDGDGRRSIDAFLSSLGEDVGDLAVGILLSGGGSDGTLGMKVIKEKGGLTMAQVADGSAPYQSNMPDTAIASGVIDLAIPVEEMAQRLVEHAGTLAGVEYDEALPEEAGTDAASERYQAIYTILLNQVGHDFSGYKLKTFSRRVRRRMQVRQIKSLDRYIDTLRGSSEEVTLLFRDLLIGVTSFFRDSEAFTTLAEEVLPKLLEDKKAADTVRIWVPGCATGEEAYSLAILLRETMVERRVACKVQIFATDIDEAALGIARLGRYPEPLLEGVSAGRLQHYFAKEDSTYTVTKEIRDMCVFSAHSVLRDPPFSRIDLVSCRNLLIYLGPQFQGQVIPVFHFALRPRGYLFLGNSENVTQHGDLFAPVDKRHRIFQRRDHALAAGQLPAFRSALHHLPSGAGMRRQPSEMTGDLRRAAEARVAERYSPAHVVINADGDILHYSARTGKYLEPAAGMPNRQLLAMTRRGLRLDLRAVLREVMETRRTATRERVAVELEDRVQLVNLLAEPFGDNDSDPLFMVVFADVGPPFVPSDAEARSKSEGDLTQERLEQELRDTRERLQATVEEYETAVEEQKSSNEELQSINEELQSTNEELETSKEELQSVNEELHTVNAELNAKVDEFDRANADLQNLFASTGIAIVFLDHKLVIRSFTPAVTTIFNLISTDRGRPLTDIVSHVELGALRRDILTVLERGETVERNVSRVDGKAHFFMRVLPYRSRHGATDGVLVTFVDVTKLIESEAQQRILVEELNHRVRNMLTVINAIAQQTLATHGDSASFVQAFTGRIRAMGTAYSLVSQEHWSWVPLREVVRQQLAPYAPDEPARIVIEGPDVQCAPNAALGFGLVVHELATNATKHGSLSVPSGKVSVAWRVASQSEPRLLLKWREEGGPPPNGDGRKGFGTRFLQLELEQALQASATFDFGKTGLVLEISIPLDAGRIALTPNEEASHGPVVRPPDTRGRGRGPDRHGAAGPPD